VIGNSVEIIGDEAFDYCIRLTSIILPNSVKKIGNYAFASCNKLQTLIIPASVQSIGDEAFLECSSLSEVYYCSNYDEWENISIGKYNDSLNSATIYYYSETEPTVEGNYWHYDKDGITPVVWKK
jgi:hypothetical protein